TPAADFNGPASFQYTITDNGTTNGLADPKSSTATVNFNVTEVRSEERRVGEEWTSVGEDSGQRKITIASLLANDTRGPTDESGQTLTLTALDTTVRGAVSLDAMSADLTPAANFNGPASFQYTITDNGTTNGLADPKSSTATVNFNVTEV